MVECASEGCSWRLHASVLKDKRTFCIKTCREEHTCIRVDRNCMANAKWIARKIEKKLRDDRTLNVKTLQLNIYRNYNVVLDQSIYRGKRKALRKIDESHWEQYSKLCNYCLELHRTNPGTRALICVDRPLLDSPLNFQEVTCMF